MVLAVREITNLGHHLHPFVTQHGFNLALFACSTGKDAEKGIGHEIAEQLAEEGDDAHIFTHTTAGPTTKNAHVREFDAADGKVTSEDLGYSEIYPLLFPGDALAQWLQTTFGGEPPISLEQAVKLTTSSPSSGRPTKATTGTRW